MACSSRLAGQPVASTTSQPKSARSGGTTSCRARRRVPGNRVRRHSWRPTTSASAAPSASTSSCPLIATPSPCCRPARAPATGRGTTTGSGRTTTEPPRAARRPPTAHADPLFTETGRQLGNRGRVEQGAHRKAGIQAGVDRGDHPHRRERIPAQVEEGVVDADPLDVRAPGRRCRPGSPRPRWPGRGNDRHPGTPVRGRARVSSLPLTVNGNASNTTTAAGTM